jgi:hypothetical protein
MSVANSGIATPNSQGATLGENKARRLRGTWFGRKPRARQPSLAAEASEERLAKNPFKSIPLVWNQLEVGGLIFAARPLPGPPSSARVRVLYRGTEPGEAAGLLLTGLN